MTNQMKFQKIDTGDLIYVPSEVLLYKISPNSEKVVVEEYKKIKEPMTLLVTGVNSTTFEVFYDNEYWLVKQNQAYQT